MRRLLRPKCGVLMLLWIAATANAACSVGGSIGTIRDGGPRPFAGDTGAKQSSTEVCENGLDDDEDRLVDEDCSCTEGSVQACWPGSAASRGQGACRDGMQSCRPDGEFSVWGSCEGAVLPSDEIEGNEIDEDCNGMAGSGCVASEFGESCVPGMDADCDGRVGCDDPDCASSILCLIDLGGPDAGPRRDAGDGECPDPHLRYETEIHRIELLDPYCHDGIDQDCDGYVDCDDADCFFFCRPACSSRGAIEVDCTDGRDDDCDGRVDCSDADCERCLPGSVRYCDDLLGICHWGRATCNADGRWGTCEEITADEGLPPLPDGCSYFDVYTEACCVDAGLCCEANPGVPGEGGGGASVGDCDTIVTGCGGDM